MICPPGRMDTAEFLAELRPENVREIVESPFAGDRFILINDSEQARTWAGGRWCRGMADKTKGATRARMRATGEPYTIARRKVIEEHQPPGRDPAGGRA